MEKVTHGRTVQITAFAWGALSESHATLELLESEKRTERERVLKQGLLRTSLTDCSQTPGVGSNWLSNVAELIALITTTRLGTRPLPHGCATYRGKQTERETQGSTPTGADSPPSQRDRQPKTAVAGHTGSPEMILPGTEH